MEAGIKWLQSLKAIVIDPDRCPFPAKEFSEYEYERDAKTGEVLKGFPDAANHSIDARPLCFGTGVEKERSMIHKTKTGYTIGFSLSGPRMWLTVRTRF